MAKKKVARKVKASSRKPARSMKKATAKRPVRRAPAPQMDEAAMMAAWQKAMTPGANHQRLEPFVGSWNARTTFCMSPDAPEQTSEGTSENRWVLGGRYLEQRYQGIAMGMPMEGIGFTGFDNVQGKYVGTWMDSFGTGLMNSLGVGKPSDDQIPSEAEAFDPSGKRVRFSCQMRVRDNDHHTFEMWTKAPNGKRFRTLYIEYTRR
jgi:uncharacterized protein DUF1579